MVLFKNIKFSKLSNLKLKKKISEDCFDLGYSFTQIRI